MTKNKWMYAVSGLAVATVVTSAWAGDRTSRSDKTNVSFRLASGTAVAGFAAQQTADGQTIYVASQDLFALADVRGLSSSRVRDKQVVAMTLAPGVSEKLAMTSGKTGANQVAMLRGGRVVTVGSIEAIGVNEATLAGFDAGEVTRLSRFIATKGLAGEGAMVTVVPRSDTATAGGTITVDVYISNVTGLRTYQFGLQVSGGTAGTLTRDHGVVDVTKPEFVFGTDQVIQAVDEQYGRFGATLFQGSKDVKGQKYVGTYTYNVSSDASGPFTIDVDQSRVSFLTDTEGRDLAFHTTPTTVTVR